MVDPRLLDFLQALGPFVERMHWLLPESGRGQPVPVDRVRALLAEWDELESRHLPLPSAHLQTTIQPVLKLVQGWRVRIQAEFMFAILEMLEAWGRCRSSEDMMKLPGVIKRCLAEGRTEEVQPLLDDYRAARGSEFDAEVAFRAMMAGADKKEAIWQAKLKALQRDWSECWTPEMQARLDAGDRADLLSWHRELHGELERLAEEFPGLVTPPAEWDSDGAP